MNSKTREITVFAMLGALMYGTKALMEIFPNMHLTATLIIAYTVVYRKKALYPLYTFVMLNGLFAGFATWWIPYLYVWTVLWAIVMLLPQNMPAKIKPIVYMAVGGVHGLLFGTIYAPAQALLYGLNYEGMIAWIVAGFPFDCIHAVSNVICGLLIVPIINILRKLENYTVVS